MIDSSNASQDLLPSNPVAQALARARERTLELQVFFGDPGVRIDANHIERALGWATSRWDGPMGRKNFLFCWTELGAQHVGTRRFHDSVETCLRCRGIRVHHPVWNTQLTDMLRLTKAGEPR